jgi:hypothetical protein
MIAIAWIGMLVGLAVGQSAPASSAPAYVREGDRVEQEFRNYSKKLDKFYSELQSTIKRDIPGMLPQLQEAPPQPVVYGYQLLPRIVANAPADRKPVTSFSYSWPITRGYVEGEGIKLERAEAQVQLALKATGVTKSALLLSLINSYKELLNNQRVIDQYVGYNRLWQRIISESRPRYDEINKLYQLLQFADPDDANAIRQMLGQPLVPSSISVLKDDENHHVTLHVPVYTDIEDDVFLAQAKFDIESVWQAKDETASYSVEVEFRKISASSLYENQTVPKRGEHIDVNAHTARFPAGALVLTTGAEITNAVVKRVIALGPGDISIRTFAHEFGHLLGFPDGYIRGYKDLGEKGIEILELTQVFDDIMSSPRDGAVQPAHFKLILETIKKHNESSSVESEPVNLQEK